MGFWFYVMLSIGTLIVIAMSVTLIGVVNRQVTQGELRKHVR